MHKHLNARIIISEIEGADKFIVISERRLFINIKTVSPIAIKESLMEFQSAFVGL